MNDEQEDIDSAAEHQQSQDEQQRENSGVMDPRCFTKPFPPLPRLTPKEQLEVEMAQAKALDWAIRRLFR